MFKFYLDNIEVNPPSNWMEVSAEIIRDLDNRILYVKMPQEFTWTGHGYTFIKDKFDSVGYCGEIEIIIQKECENGYSTIITGIIFIRQCVFLADKCSVDLSITDNSFFAKINNNKNVKTILNSGIAKDGTVITETPLIAITLHNSDTGADYPDDRYVYDWFEAIKYIIAFATNGEMSAVSDWYSSLVDDEKFCIVRGKQLRNAGLVDYEIALSFNELFYDLAKDYDLWLSIDGSNLRIEPIDYYYNTTSLFTIEKIKDIKQYFYEQIFYSNLILGSYKYIRESTNPLSFDIYTGITFVEETYAITGNCNIDQTLDLKWTKFIKDNNIIHELLFYNNDNYDDDIFIIQYNSATNKSAQYEKFAKYVYNRLLLNDSVLNRITATGDFAKYFGNLTNKFRASSILTTAPFLVPTAPGQPLYTDVFFNLGYGMDNDWTAPNFDSGGNYDTTNITYLIPQTGLYFFQTQILLNVYKLVAAPPGQITRFKVEANFVRQLPGPVFIESKYITLADNDGNTVFSQDYSAPLNELQVSGNVSFDADVNDEILYSNVRVTMLDANNILGFQIIKDSFWANTVNPSTGGIYKENNTFLSKSSLFSFTKKISESQVRQLLLTPYKAVTFGSGNINKKAWANNIIIKLATNDCDFELISDLENSN